MKIGIVGGGVIGLTSGIVLAEAGHNVEILTRDSFEKMTSYAAGAVCYPFGVEESPRVIKWFKQTHEILEELKVKPDAGIFEARWRKLSQAQRMVCPFWFKDIKSARVLEAGDPMLPDAYCSGITVNLPIMAVDTYFPWLQERFVRAGGLVTMRTVESLLSVSADYDLLVNATGVWARQFCNDDAVYPARGQVVIVKNPGIEYHTALDEEIFYMYPRGEQCLLGGSFDVDAWDLTPDDDLTQKILSWAGQMEPKLRNPEVLSVRVGLRPMRDKIRLEREVLAGGTPIIHNYGHGGAGYTMSWGCAFDVLKLVENA